MSNFRDWSLPKLIKRFKLNELPQSDLLEAWISTPIDLDELEENVATFVRNHLKSNYLYWNEQELSMHAIGPIYTFVNFTTSKCNLFELRELNGVVDGEVMSGKPDGMVASGKVEPEIPYFCFHEYKKELDPDGDPIGQCLAAMLVAREKNETSMPIFGVVIVGENWRFMILQDNDFAISSSFSATTDEIFSIFSILKYLKKIVLQRVGLLP
jgi:hypothetical protein